MVGENVPVVDAYRYLGVVFNTKWNWSNHAEYVCNKVDVIVNRDGYRLWKTRTVDVKTKVRAWKSVYRFGRHHRYKYTYKWEIREIYLA